MPAVITSSNFFLIPIDFLAFPQSLRSGNIGLFRVREMHADFACVSTGLFEQTLDERFSLVLREAHTYHDGSLSLIVTGFTE